MIAQLLHFKLESLNKRNINLCCCDADHESGCTYVLIEWSTYLPFNTPMQSISEGERVARVSTVSVSMSLFSAYVQYLNKYTGHKISIQYLHSHTISYRIILFLLSDHIPRYPTLPYLILSSPIVFHSTQLDMKFNLIWLR